MKKRRGSGYTILEVMIFMAISASMFVLAITSIGGRQQQVRFTQAVRDFDSKLQDVLNDVSTGYYQTAGRISCDVAPGANSRPNVGYDDPEPAGTNSECVFIGKVIHFSPDNGAGDNQSHFNIYDVVGRRYVDSDVRPVNLAEAKPVAVRIANINEFQSGMKVTKIAREDNPAINTIGAIGVFTGTNKNIQADYSSNNESINVATIPGTAFDYTPDTIYGITDQITDVTGFGGNYIDMNSTARIVVCLSDTDNKRKASITFGGNEISTKLDFDTYNTEVCGL